MNRYKRYCLLSVLGVLLASFYPLYMGGRVILDMIAVGAVVKENYPKYIIPYTPISLAIILGVIVMPVAIRYVKHYSFAVLSVVSTGVFFLSEFLLESKVVVSSITETVTTTKLEAWQMYMCISPSRVTTRVWTDVDVLLGEYSPTFKIHFYVISLVIILCFLNCFYGFAKMIRDNNTRRLKALILQSVSVIIFLGLCILACFTAFFRTGELQVSALSVGLMATFFIVLGVTTGIYIGSFLLERAKRVSVVIPATSASVMTLLMYIGELCLLDGHLYRFGNGFFFEGLGGIVLAPIDLLVVFLSGGISAVILSALSKAKIKGR